MVKPQQNKFTNKKRKKKLTHSYNKTKKKYY